MQSLAMLALHLSWNALPRLVPTSMAAIQAPCAPVQPNAHDHSGNTPHNPHVPARSCQHAPPLGAFGGQPPSRS